VHHGDDKFVDGRPVAALQLGVRQRDTACALVGSHRDDLKSLVVDEVLEVAGVQRGQRHAEGQAAGCDPCALTGRGRPRLSAYPESSLDVRATSSVNGIGGRAAIQRSSAVRRVVPQFRMTDHLVNSPIVTRVMASCLPMSFGLRCAQPLLDLMIEGATSVSRITGAMSDQARLASRSARTTLRNSSSSSSVSNTSVRQGHRPT
jgi:hypothetical protein